MKINAFTWLNAYNNDGDAGTGTGGNGQGGEGGNNNPPPNPPNPGGKTFTQDEVNKFVAERSKKATERAEQLEKQLKDMLDSKNLTEKEKTEYQARLEEIQTANMSKEEQWKKENEKISKGYTKQVETLAGERDSWKKRFDTLMTDLEIRKAGKTNNCFNEDQMVEILGRGARMREKVGADGKATGDYEAVLSFTDEKDEKPFSVELPVADAIKRMKELPHRYGNLFKSDNTPGLGGGTNGSGLNVPLVFDESMSDETYDKFRKTQLGLKK